MCLLGAALLALVGGIAGKRTQQVERATHERSASKCAYDGAAVHTPYQVEAYLLDGTVLNFCSIHCASGWLRETKRKVAYLTVMDEITGQKFDSSLGSFVESEIITVKAVNNRIHPFFSEQDAFKHARQFNGRLVENPFGNAFVVPAIARFDSLNIGTPLWPDSLPLRLATLKPIFKENRLDVRFLSVAGDESAMKLLADGSIQGLVCDLPTAIVLSSGQPSTRIIKNILRANPFRPLFAIVSSQNNEIRDLAALNGKQIAVPKGISFRFYLEYYFKQANVPLEAVVVREVEDVSSAWNLLANGEVAAALLRTPYTSIALENRMPILADDRNWPWMSVLIVSQSVINTQSEILNRLLFGLEQSVLALNLKPDEYRVLLQGHGGLPDGLRTSFAMPIFEGANAPAKDEIEPIVLWLKEKGLFDHTPVYEDFVNTQFLPDPKNVGLAFCCR